MKHMPRVLIVEDEPAIAELLAVNLRHSGFQPTWAMDSVTAQCELDAVLPDVILLDWMLPGESGLSLARKWRADPRTKGVPIIMLTARGDEHDRVAGLDAGADDYVTKPFELPELAARVRVFGRRRTGQAQPLLEVGPLVFDTVGREVRVNGERLSLSVRELSVLEMLLARVGRVVTKRQIVNSLSAWDADFSENAVEVYVYRLRKRLEGTGASIQTVRGFGYLLDVDGQASA